MLLAFLGAWPAMASPVLSEFLASNTAGLKDEDGEPSDWIEILNPGPAEVSMQGWSLTDDPALPGKWRFPDVRILPGNRLVVFASGKDRPGPGPLHANFRLAEEGEYLGLFPPDGKVAATEFRPAFPRQERDVAFGIPGSAAERDLLESAPVRVLVPTSAAEVPDDWAGPEPGNEAAWLALPGLGVGFDPTPPGPVPDENLAARGTVFQSSTGFSFGPGLAVDGDPDSFTHTATDDDASAWWVDLGEVHEISRVVIRNRTSCCQSRLRDLTVTLLGADGATVVWTSDLLNPENELAGPPTLTLDFFELNVGPIPARSVRITRTPDPDLSGSGGVGNADEDNVLSLGEVEVYGVASLSYAGWIRSDLAPAMRGRNASALVRVPFVLANPAEVRTLSLELWYDDGVVAHLNGGRVFESNAPPVFAWDARATSDRPKADGIQPTVLDLGAFRDRWVAGTNWLAFHVLNVAPDDPDLLLHASLKAATDPGVPYAYLERPTPGAPNEGPWHVGLVADTRFSVGRGLHREPVTLEILCDTPGAEIRYTLDGSPPGSETGLRYTGPIRIERTTVVRAAAFKPGYRPTNVDTHTYVFPADVAVQPRRPAGFPASWAGVSADYEVDPRIAQHPEYAPGFAENLRSLPSISLVCAQEDLFGTDRGIYANPERSGLAWERPVSMEWIDPGRDDAFQVGAGLRIQGGYFRQRSVTQKHSLRLVFKNAYGPGRLRRDLFREFGAAREFDTLVLRAGANDGYAWDAAKDTEQFIRDEFGRRLHLDMGHPSPRGRFVHLYLNGLYWGLYNLTERPAEDFSATYMGGAPEDWDAINSGDVKSGSLAAWNAFVAAARSAAGLADYQRLKGLNPDGSRNPAQPAHLDAPNYIDYMLVNLWGGNWDWPNKNFWFGRHRTNLASGFRFYIWDFENTMGNNRDRSPLNMLSPRASIESAWVAEPHFRLQRLEEYRMEFADRVQRHLFNGGVLTPGSLVARYQALADQVEPAIVPETARWGDDHHSPPQDLADWRRERDWILGTYLVQRSGIVLDQLRSQGLYPRTPAPEAFPPGGSVTPLTPVQLTTAASELYYTTNGLDPRLPGGGVRPGAVRVVFNVVPDGAEDPDLVRSGASWRYLDDGSNPGPGWFQAAFDDTGWREGPSPLGYGDGDEATTVRFVDADPAQAGVQRNATTWFRHAFEVASPGAWDRLRLSVTYDDAAAVYLNGTEILRTPNLPADARFNTYATGTVPDNSVMTLTNLPPSLLRAGRNVVAVEIHQSDGASSDISFDLELLGVSDTPPVVHATEPFFLAAPTLLRARARQGTEWSALTEVPFTLGTVPVSSNLVVVSQFCYRPPEPATDAERAVSENRDDYEFLELLNIGTQPIDLGGARFVAGILHVFEAGTILEPGKRGVLVSRRDAFVARYGSAVPILGTYDGRLDSAGEELALVDARGGDLRRFRYGDSSPWPSLPDAAGFALVLQRPGSNPDHADPLQWRSSLVPGGSPGTSDTATFVGAPLSDTDGNGQADLLDYAFGVPAGGIPEPLELGIEARTIGAVTTRHLAITFPRNPVADDAPVVLEVARDVNGPWSAGMAAFELLFEERIEPRRSRLTYRCLEPIDASSSLFVRVQVVHRP